jgi:cytidine deaminase
MPPSSPISGPGNLYLAANMEFTNEALSLCVHGEQSAVNHALIQGETGLQSLAINAAPCGYCRQFLYEITTAKTLNILRNWTRRRHT